VVDFIELSAPSSGTEIDLEEVLLGKGCDLEGEKVGRISSDGGLVVVALKREGEQIQLSPSPEESLCSFDRLVVVGHSAELRELSRRARPQTS
jgi:K+/H+ antiporter YhaU regulatory subunit KhtT